MPVVLAILKAFQAMEKSGGVLAECLRKDRALPFKITTFAGDQSGPAAHEAAIASLTRLHHPEKVSATEPLFHAGILCVSPDTVAAATAFNTAKSRFKDIVTQYRTEMKDKKTRLDRLMEKAHRHQRPEKLSRIMKVAKISGADLTRCYAQVRILPENTRSISWTWAIQELLSNLVFGHQIKQRSDRLILLQDHL